MSENNQMIISEVIQQEINNLEVSEYTTFEQCIITLSKIKQLKNDQNKEKDKKIREHMRKNNWKVISLERMLAEKSLKEFKEKTKKNMEDLENSLSKKNLELKKLITKINNEYKLQETKLEKKMADLQKIETDYNDWLDKSNKSLKDLEQQKYVIIEKFIR